MADWNCKVVLSEYEDEKMLDDLGQNVVDGLKVEQRENVHVVGHSWGDDRSLQNLKA